MERGVLVCFWCVFTSSSLVGVFFLFSMSSVDSTNRGGRMVCGGGAGLFPCNRQLSVIKHAYLIALD